MHANHGWSLIKFSNTSTDSLTHQVQVQVQVQVQLQVQVQVQVQVEQSENEIFCNSTRQ